MYAYPKAISPCVLGWGMVKKNQCQNVDKCKRNDNIKRKKSFKQLKSLKRNDC